MRVKKLTGFIIPILSILLAFVIGAIIMMALGASPLVALQSLIKGSFGNAAKVGTTLNKAMPLMFTSLCACFAYKCGVFNLGGEGQFIMGAIASLCVALLSGLEGPLACVLALTAGAVAGGLWGMIPGFLKITRGQNEMIISIMLNYVATLFMGVIYTNWLRDASVPQTLPVPDATLLGRVFPKMRFTWGFVIALVIGLFMWFILFRTSLGFRLRAVGFNQTAAHFNGYSVRKLMLFSFIISGAVAGLGGAADLQSTQLRLINGFGKGYGFDGVAMALIGQLNPIATMLVSIFFAALRTGSTTMQAATGVPTSVSDIIQSLVIVFSVAGMALTQLPEFDQFLNRFRKEAK